MNQKLKKKIIMQYNEEFQHIYRNSKTLSDRYIVMHIIYNNKYNHKVGFAAGKKLGNAVTRNHLKRILREIYRKNTININGNCCILLVARMAAVTADYDTINKSFNKLVKKAGITKAVRKNDKKISS